MVRGAGRALVLALAWACVARGSVLVPTYVLPPESFTRDQRSLGPPPDSEHSESRTIKRLIGGHVKNKDYASAKNSLDFEDKKKFANPPETPVVGWNQGIWDDGMLMSSAGEGKDASKTKEVDEDKKTLSDQVAEGKYGLIQNEIFAKPPKRPGVLSYEPNTETRSVDNIQSLGGLKKEEIWLAEDHLLVLKGGSYPERHKESDRGHWPPIDAYEAPKRQVKLPPKPKVPPPFPVQLTDDGPLVFLTPNGSVPASFFPAFNPGEGENSLPYPPFPFPPGASYPQGDDPGNSTAGGAPQPIPPFPFLPGNATEGNFPFPPSINASFPDGFPPGAVFLPPPSNQSDLYDEDDPSIYYPPPYNFSYHTDYNSSVPAGPLVPGIILPPPPDFFAPMEEKTTEPTTTTTKPTSSVTYTYTKPSTKQPTTPSQRYKYKTRPTTTESTVEPSTITTPPPVQITPKVRKPQRVVQIPSRRPVVVQNLPEEIVTIPKTEKPVYKIRQKVTSKPLSVSVIYDYPEPENKLPTTTEKPYVYNVPEKTPVTNNLVTSTQVPLRAYYSSTQNDIPTTKLQPVYSKKPNDLASFYFYEEQPKTAPSPTNFYDGRNYYKTVNPTPSQQTQNSNTQQFSPVIDVAYGSIDQGDTLYLWPQKQGPRTLTQEYFSIQKPRQQQQVYSQQSKRPNPFYQQIADIQQTIDLFTTKRPKPQSHRPQSHKPKAIPSHQTSRPVYQFSFQSQPRPDQYSFRAPKLDPEPFRPMVSYSKPFNLGNEFNAITPPVSSAYHQHQQYLVENVQVTTETPAPTKYYPKSRVKEDDYDEVAVKPLRPKANKNQIYVSSNKQINYNNVPNTTPNPVSHGYYTKQDEKYLDDITKNSFDIFGKKLEDGTHLGVTPPLDTARNPIDNDINLQYVYDVETQSPNPPNLDRDTLVNDRYPRPTVNPQSESIHVNAELVQPQKPPSLADDTLVNDRFPRPQINPDSEFIPIPNPGYRQAQQYRIPSQVQRPQYQGEQYDLNQPSLVGDIAVNYKRPLPPVNPDAEWISPVNSAGEGRPGSFVSYRLPGEGAHVYFLTPQAAQAQSNRERYRSPGYGR